MGSITIPEVYTNYFQEKEARGGRDWQGYTQAFVRNVQSVLDEKPAYFEHYTEHGSAHIQQVLELSARLIPRRTLHSMECVDVAVMLMSLLAHDIGMFLHEPGLRILLAKQEWAERWDAYRKELRNMSDGQMLALFGPCYEQESRTDFPDAQTVRAMTGRLSKWQDRLCGEFLRRHHHELAEEVIRYGFPLRMENGRPRMINLFENAGEAAEYRGLVALIARSHQQELEAFRPLDAAYGVYDDTNPGRLSGVPVYYLMAVLRLADDLDAGRGRASWVREALCDVDNEVSRREFAWNRYVMSLRDSAWSDEGMRLSLSVTKEDGQGRPITSTVFQKIEAWIRDAQKELDVCWRFLSMYYKGNQEDGLRLSIREITSNILQRSGRDEFAKTIVLEPARLTARAEILSLLAAPLYNDNPTYGVRELLQNAVDACRERQALEGGGYEGCVRVTLDSQSEKPGITFTDNGVGMTEQVILRHFLIAGSSLRQSHEWRNQYDGKRVYRSGRFGIGVLAAFLLGEAVRVETLPRGQQKGYAFSMRKGMDEDLDIGHVDFSDDELFRLGGGTRIRVDLEPDAARRLREDADCFEEEARRNSLKRTRSILLRDTVLEIKDEVPFWESRRFAGPSPFAWYWLASPRVVYDIDGHEWPNPCALEEQYDWIKLRDVQGLDELWWRPETPEHSDAWCNGIKVKQWVPEAGMPEDLGADNPRDLLTQMNCSVAVMDSKGAMNINLSREQLLLPRRLEAALLAERVKLGLACLMLLDVRYHYEEYGDIIMPFLPQESKSFFTWSDRWFVLGPKGFLMDTDKFHRHLEGQRIWEMAAHPNHKATISNAIWLGTTYGPLILGMMNAYTMGWMRHASEMLVMDEYRIDVVHAERNTLYVDAGDDGSTRWKKMQPEDEPQIEESAADGSFACRDKTVLFEGTGNERIFFTYALARDFPRFDMPESLCERFELFAGYRALPSQPRPSCPEMDAVYERYFGEAEDPWIPFELEERRRKFPRFFDPDDEMYRYMRYVGDHFSGQGFYRPNEATGEDEPS